MHDTGTKLVLNESVDLFGSTEADALESVLADSDKELLLSTESSRVPISSNGLVVAQLVGLTNGVATIIYQIDDCHFVREALAIVGHPLDQSDVGSEVCLAFADNDVEKPVILGRFRQDSARSSSVSLESDTQITLRCGKASISLKADGTVAIRGTNVASRASHTNRIRGGNVQIN